MFHVSSIERKSVCRTTLHTDPAKAFVHCAKTIARFFHFNVQVMRVVCIDRILIENSYCSLRIAAPNLFPSHKRFGKFKRAVLHSFRIQSAVGAEVNVFKENSKHRGRNVATGLVYLDSDVAGLRDSELRLKRETQHTNQGHESRRRDY